MAFSALLFRFALVCAPLGGAIAQSAQPTQQPPAASDGSPLPFTSTFEGYQRFSDEKVGSWRDANDNVGRIGGWREYAREARPSTGGAAPGPAAVPSGAAAPAAGARPAPGAPAAPAAKDPHAGHGTK